MFSLLKNYIALRLQIAMHARVAIYIYVAFLSKIFVLYFIDQRYAVSCFSQAQALIAQHLTHNERLERYICVTNQTNDNLPFEIEY
jgi:hypothetical protein